jgi:hypothetical protein
VHRYIRSLEKAPTLWGVVYCPMVVQIVVKSCMFILEAILACAGICVGIVPVSSEVIEVSRLETCSQIEQLRSYDPRESNNKSAVLNVHER